MHMSVLAGRWGWFWGGGVALILCATEVTAQPSGVPLIEAVRERRADVVDQLLVGTDANTPTADGTTALHWAVFHDAPEMTERLLGAGADAALANELGVTPLALACENANADLVTRLLQAGADPSASVETGETVLMGCARTGNDEAVRALIAAGAAVNARESHENQTALMWAAARGHVEVVRRLLRHGADVRARSKVRRQVISRRLQSELRYGELGRRYGTDAEETQIGGFTPLLFAARQGHVAVARLLLDGGADVNDRAPDGSSALVVATHSGHRVLTKFLLSRGANTNTATAGYTALHAAVLTGDLEVVEALLAHGARPDAQVTLATRVTRNGQVLMLGEHLLGATPLALAAKFTESDILRTLLAAGGDVHLPLKNGWTPLMLAAGASWRYAVWDRRDRAVAKAPAFQAQMYDEAGTLEAVRILLDEDAELNLRDDDGNTALHYLVDKGFDEVVRLLADRGADLSLTNRRGDTPLAIVERGRTGNIEASVATVALLRSLPIGENNPASNRSR